MYQEMYRKIVMHIPRACRPASSLALVVLLGIAAPGVAQPADQEQSIRVYELDGQEVDPFAVSDDAVTVFVFVSVDCPVSNRYAPEIQRLSEKFLPSGMRFVLVYPNPSESVEAVDRHLEEYGYGLDALRDPDHSLVSVAGATITPEAAVYDRSGALLYRGRIDNRYVSLGLERPAATVHDLEDVLTAAAAGEPRAASMQPAVGCFIADFVHIH